jgi:hypothetical protein
MLTHPSGGVYEGNFENNKQNGYGVDVHPNGARYEGEWKDNKYHGEGKIAYPNGCTYVGAFVDDRKHGSGILVDPEAGISYQGQWENNQYHGHGVFSNSSGRFEGNFTRGVMHGQGVLLSKEGLTYEGEFRYWEPCGFGKVTCPDGTSVEREFLIGAFLGLRKGQGAKVKSAQSTARNQRWRKQDPRKKGKRGKVGVKVQGKEVVGHGTPS